MSLPPSEQNTNEPDSGRGPERENDSGQRNRTGRQASAEADPALGAQLSIIPVAPMHWRMLAFLLDGILIVLFATLLLTKVLLPEYHPVGYSQYWSQSEEYAQAIVKAIESKEPVPQKMDYMHETEEIREMFMYMAEIFALCMLVYFILCERFMAGGSIGKSMLRLRVISLNTGSPPSIWESFLRGLIKLCPFVGALPLVNFILFIANYFFPFGNRMRRAGHDWLARTLVVSDVGGYVPRVKPPRRQDEEDEY